MIYDPMDNSDYVNAALEQELAAKYAPDDRYDLTLMGRLVVLDETDESDIKARAADFRDIDNIWKENHEEFGRYYFFDDTWID
jgi:hypothetical protein